ncbi:MAG: response regulator transcription factor [Specibacter sp.]
MVFQCVRVGIVDDHDAVLIGFAAGARLDARAAQVPVVVVGAEKTVAKLLSGPPNMFDVVVLDMSLADGSAPGENVRKILAAAYPVLVFSTGDNTDCLREALAAGASGVSRKSEEIRHTLELVRLVAAGQTIDNQELAIAITLDAGFVRAELSERERETLRLYATGFTAGQIGTRMNISANTVGTNIKRIREKYAAAGRHAPTKLELYHRALEDGVIPLRPA